MFESGFPSDDSTRISGADWFRIVLVILGFVVIAGVFYGGLLWALSALYSLIN